MYGTFPTSVYTIVVTGRLSFFNRRCIRYSCADSKRHFRYSPYTCHRSTGVGGVFAPTNYVATRETIRFVPSRTTRFSRITSENVSSASHFAQPTLTHPPIRTFRPRWPRSYSRVTKIAIHYSRITRDRRHAFGPSGRNPSKTTRLQNARLVVGYIYKYISRTNE